MEKQKQKGRIDLKRVCYPSDVKRAAVITSSVSNYQMKEIDPAGEGQAARVRKPYTITKQRERWTEGEHQKFLEAVQLYGRAWRRIKEHIGSKTTVQIRSHAQKFFSKVVNKAGTNDKTEIIDIPPPRPKRKPVQPYPRKLGNMLNKGTLKQLEKPPRQLSAICEQENGSPTSVLQAIGSETPGRSHPSAADSNDQDDGGHSPNLKVEHKLPYDCSAAPGSTIQDQHQMDMDECSGVHTSSESQATTLKLFGKMVVVADANKAFASSAGNPANPKLASAPQRVDHQYKNVVHLHFKPDMSLRSDTQAGNACLGLIPPPMFYCSPFAGDSFVEPSVFPWWPTYCNIPSPFIHSRQYPVQPSIELIHGEGSRTGSSTVSTGCVADDTDGVHSSNEVNLEGNIGMHCSITKSINNTPASKRGRTKSSSSGFVPYRSCAAEIEKQQHTAIAS